MLAEHIVYNTAIAIIAGMLFFRLTGRDSSWIIILVTYVPDLDKITGPFLKSLGITVLVHGNPIQHGTFHNIAAMILFAIFLAFILSPLGLRFFDTVLFAVIGFGSHLLEDALVYTSNYAYLWPFYSQRTGLGWLPVSLSEESYQANFFHIANAEVLAIGMLFLAFAIIIRTRFEGPEWIRWYMPKTFYEKYFTSTKVPAAG